MLWIHPFLQLLATGMALYALHLGWPRFRANHFGQSGPFAQAQHAAYGKYACILWMCGLVLGQYAIASRWGDNGITGVHYWIGQTMMPCIAGGYITGVIMERGKKRVPYLPLVHAAFSILAVALALAEIVTGVVVIRDFILA